MPNPKNKIPRNMRHEYSEYTIDEIQKYQVASKRYGYKMVIDGRLTSFKSDVMCYFLARKDKLICTKCNLQAGLFVHLRDTQHLNLWHMQLYGENDGGDLILFTRDHIKPKSKGGPDRVSNLQIMCLYCNVRKGSKYA